MPFRICKVLEIENGHMLTWHRDKCRFPHGHSRRVEIILEADELDASGMVCDFKIIKDAAGRFLDMFDHALCVNTRDPMFATLKEAYGDRVVAFPDTEPTSEALARRFFHEIAGHLSAYSRGADGPCAFRSEVRLKRVRVWETSSSWAEYEA